MQIEQHEIIITIGIASLQGNLDDTALNDLQALWDYYEARGIQTVVINLGRVNFIDSAGVNALVSGMKRLRARGGDLRLASIPSSTRSLLELMMLDKIFEIFENEETALKGL